MRGIALQMSSGILFTLTTNRPGAKLEDRAIKGTRTPAWFPTRGLPCSGTYTQLPLHDPNHQEGNIPFQGAVSDLTLVLVFVVATGRYGLGANIVAWRHRLKHAWGKLADQIPDLVQVLASLLPVRLHVVQVYPQCHEALRWRTLGSRCLCTCFFCWVQPDLLVLSC